MAERRQHERGIVAGARARPLQFGDGFLVHPFLLISQAEEIVREIKVRINLKRSAELHRRLVVAARVVEVLAKRRVDDGRERVKLLRALDLGHGFRRPVHHRKKVGIPVMRGRVVRVQLDGAQVFALSPGAVIVVLKFD